MSLYPRTCRILFESENCQKTKDMSLFPWTLRLSGKVEEKEKIGAAIFSQRGLRDCGDAPCFGSPLSIYLVRPILYQSLSDIEYFIEHDAKG
ncbi:MAG TPA: hypothetical protein DCP92_06850 [Nitrospiraceae bacterium]|jgi:hypothetical protein|nr:hypothetical protein [Nitrospiraceae bacterium]